MLISCENNEGYFVEAYEPGRVTVNHQTYQSTIFLTAQGIMTDWSLSSYQELTPLEWDQLLAMNIHILLIGTEAPLARLPDSMMFYFSTKGCSVELMNAASACRTFNVLASEGREVGLLICQKSAP